MANALYQQHGHSANDGGLSAFIRQVKDAQKTIPGDPRAMVEGLLRSGQMSQQQFNTLAQMANGIFNAMTGK